MTVISLKPQTPINEKQILDFLFNRYVNLYRIHSLSRERSRFEDDTNRYFREELEALRKQILEMTAGALDPLLEGITYIYASPAEARGALNWLNDNGSRINREIEGIKKNKTLDRETRNRRKGSRMNMLLSIKQEADAIRSRHELNLRVRVEIQHE